jgi:hypothetical protein
LTQVFSLTEINAIMNAYFKGGSSIANATTLYFGVCTGFTGTPADAVSGEPTSTGSYARVAVSVGSSGAFTVTNGVVTNASVIQTPTSSAAWSTGASALTNWFLSRVSTIGDTAYVVGGAITVANQKAINAANEALQFPASSLTLTETGI